MKIFAQEGLGRPDLEVLAEVQSVQDFLQKTLPGREELSSPGSAGLYQPESGSGCRRRCRGARLYRPASKLKDLIRKKSKTHAVNPEELIQVREAIVPAAPIVATEDEVKQEAKSRKKLKSKRFRLKKLRRLAAAFLDL